MAFQESISNRTLDKFKSTLTGGGARPNLFEVILNFPVGAKPEASDNQDANKSTGTSFDEKTRFLVKAANLPASNITPIDIPFRGRNLKIAGDRTFDVWTITVINDTDFAIRNAMEKWMNSMNNLRTATGDTTPNDYQSDAYVYQLGRNGIKAGNDGGTINPPELNGSIPVLKGYRFYGVFPTNISAIELSYDQPDTIEEFTVDLQVQWWDALDSKGKSLFGNEAATT